MDLRWFRFVNKVSNKALYHFANHLLEHLSGVNVFNLFHTIGSAGGLYTLLAPYFVAYSMFSREKKFGEKVLARFQRPEYAASDNVAKGVPRVAHFTDTFYEVNGSPQRSASRLGWRSKPQGPCRCDM